MRLDVHGAEDEIRTRDPVHIEDGAFLGINAVVLPGVRIDRNAVVGAGSVVTHDVPAYAVVAGNPARLIRRYDADSGRWIRCEDRPLTAGHEVAA